MEIRILFPQFYSMVDKDISFMESSTVLVESISDILDRIQVFLATHPVVIWMRDNISLILWAGGTIGFTHPIKFIEEQTEAFMEDLLS